MHPFSIVHIKDCYWWSTCLNRLSWLIDLLIEVIMTVKIEIVSTFWISKVTIACWCVQLLLIFRFLCFYIFHVDKCSSSFFLFFFFNLFLLLAKFFLSILIYEFSPFTYTLVCYKNVETLFTDRVRNFVITKSPDKDMIVADQMNQVNLSCEAEGNPSVSIIWYKEPDMNNQLSTEHLLMINDLRQIKVASMRVEHIIL